jgi:hypothetical protein
LMLVVWRETSSMDLRRLPTPWQNPPNKNFQKVLE